jgi:hypothetical protein
MNVPAESKLRFQVLNQEIPSIRNNIMTKLESMVLPMSHQEWVRKLSSPQLRQKKHDFFNRPDGRFLTGQLVSLFVTERRSIVPINLPTKFGTQSESSGEGLKSRAEIDPPIHLEFDLQAL